MSDENVNVECFSDSDGNKEDGAVNGSIGRKRNYHNVLERKRRNHIKDGYLKLRDAVPAVADRKVSRIQILKRAVEHIRRAKDDIARKEMLARELKTRLKRVPADETLLL